MIRRIAFSALVGLGLLAYSPSVHAGGFLGGSGGGVLPSLPKPGGVVGDLGKKVSDGAKDVGKKVSDGAKTAGKKVSDQTKKIGGKSSDWFKEKVAKPVGAPWVRAVRDPWVRYLNRLYTTGENRLNKGREKYQDGATNFGAKVGQPMYGSEFKIQQVPGGTVGKSKIGADVLYVDAPNGGTVGFDMFESFEGRTVRITMLVMVEKGAAGKIILGRGDGTVVATSSEGGALVRTIPHESGTGSYQLRKLTFQVEVPSDRKGYGKTDSAHNYRALLQVSASSNVHVLGGDVRK